MSSVFHEEVRSLLENPPRQLRINPFHCTRARNFRVQLSAAERVLRLNRRATSSGITSEELEGLRYWARQAAIAACAVRQACRRYFWGLQDELEPLLAKLLQGLAEVLERESAEVLQQELLGIVLALQSEAPRNPEDPATYYRDPETVECTA